MIEEAETTEIITIPHKKDVPALFSTKDGIDALVAQIEKEARAIVIDATTPVGRKDAKSLAAKVSRSKTLIDEVRKEVNADAQEIIKANNAIGKMAVERLEALRDEIKAPVLEWEQKEIDRVRALERRMDLFSPERTNAQMAAETIASIIAEVNAIEIDATWEEYEADARTNKAAVLDKYRSDFGTAEVREAQEAELIKLRADAEARAKADAEREAKEAAAKIEQEREQRAAEQAKAAAAEAEARAKADAEAAEARHQAELAAAKAREEAAAKAERDRIAAEEKAKADAEAARAADKKHRQKIRQEAIDAIAALKPESVNEIVDAIIAGEIPHTKVTF